MTDQPNFLLIITDQHRADHLGNAGNKIVQTPHIDGIAERGLAYDKFYVTCPICMPNRSALMTGRMPSACGVLTNGLSLPLNSNTFVHALRVSGYRTALLGKSHLQNMAGAYLHVEDWNYPPAREGALLPDGFNDAYLTVRTGQGYENERMDFWMQDPDRKVDLPYYGFEEIQFCNGHGDRVGGHYTNWARGRHAGIDDLRGVDNQLSGNKYSAPQAWRTAVPEELHSTAFVEDKTLEFLENHAKGGTDKPFFIQTSFPDPHHPFTPPGRYWDMYDPADCPPSESLGAKHIDPAPMAERLHKEFADGKRESRVASYAVNENEARESIALTYGMISMVDSAVGRILAKLKELGMDKNTVVMFTSDHGDLMSDHGLMLKHCFHNEGLINVPFIWSDPDAPDGEAGTRTDLLGGTIDIGATVLGRAGLRPYHGMQGFDVVSAERTGTPPPRLGMMVEEDEIPLNANCGVFTRTRTFVTGRWRLTYWMEEQFGELYDRDNDPLELVNLWNDPSAKADKALLLEMMMRERIALDDMAPKAVLGA